MFWDYGPRVIDPLACENGHTRCVFWTNNDRLSNLRHFASLSNTQKRSASFDVLRVLHYNGGFCVGFLFEIKNILLPRYNGVMARPTKITDEKKLKLADFIRSGLAIKGACYGAGISLSTFNCLRAKDMKFDKLINAAMLRRLHNTIMDVKSVKLLINTLFN